MSQQQSSSWQNKANILVGAAAVIALIGLLAWAMTRPSNYSGPSALLNKPAPNFQVTLLSGDEHVKSQVAKQLSLEDFKGRPVIVNFWASWCSSCRSEAGELEAFWQAHKDKISLVGIAVQDSADAVLEYVQASGKSFPVGLDEDGQASVNYGVAGVPETFFIDGSGVVRHKVAGPLDGQILAKMLEILTAQGDKGSH